MDSETKSNIVLVGMPGVGKSTVGVLLAKQLGRYFLDTDVFIQVVTERNLQQIIDEQGLEEFRNVEESHVLCIEVENAVIATGGSVVYGEKAMAHLKENGVVVHLDLPLEKIKQRVQNLNSRGLVIEKGKTLDDLYRQRQPLYRRYADITIDCTDKNQDQLVAEIIKKLPLS